MILRAFQPKDTPAVMQVWLRSVTATHDFLSPHDIDFYYRKIESHYLSTLEVYVAVDKDNVITGFIGIDGQHIQMLFVDSEHFRRGIGKKLLAWVESRKGHFTLEVNAQNPDALDFYLSQGYKEISRSSVDESGRHFPLVHLAKDVA